MEVVHGSVAAADGVGAAERLRDVLLGVPNGVRQGLAAREVGGDGGGEGTASAVGGGRVDPRRAEVLELPTVVQNIYGVLRLAPGRAVAPFHDDGSGT